MNLSITTLLTVDEFENIKPLLNNYKKAIHEETLNEIQFDNLKKAIKDDRIRFYISKIEDEIVGICSVSTLFSTYQCSYMGVFEDFYVEPKYRGKGLASKLVKFVFSEMNKMNIKSVWVGCADVDLEMYKHLGFNLELGNLLTWCND